MKAKLLVVAGALLLLGAFITMMFETEFQFDNPMYTRTMLFDEIGYFDIIAGFLVICGAGLVVWGQSLYEEEDD